MYQNAISSKSKKYEKRVLSGNTIKLIASLSMMIDHVGAMLLLPLINQHSGNAELYYIYILCRLFGRLAFPLYGFLIAEGITHSKNLKKYIGRLFLFAIISEIPFDLAYSGKIVSTEYQNIFFTLAISVLAIAVAQKTTIWKQLVIVLMVAGVAEVINSNYGAIGVIGIADLYLCRDSFYIGSVFFVYIIIKDSVSALVSGNSLYYISFVLAGIWLLIIQNYNGKRGQKNLKMFFYWFYPVHLLVLVLLKNIL